MTSKCYTVKLIAKLLTIAVVMFIAYICHSMAPAISNELALTQMQNSNAALVFMDARVKIGTIVSVISYSIALVLSYGIVRDTYNFVKTINTEN